MSQMPPSAFDQPRSLRVGLATSALVCALCGLCIPGAGLVGLVLGIIALTKVASTPQTHGGKGMAIAGIVLGVFSILWIPIAVGIFLPALGQARYTARQLKSSTQMSRIGRGLGQYASDNKDWLPESGADLSSRLATYNVQADQFVSPRAEPGATDSYIYIPGYNQSTLATPTAIVVLYENPKYIPRGKVNVLFADGHVDAFPVASLQSVLDSSPKPTPPSPKPASNGQRP